MENEDKTEKKRLAWIDICKGLAMFMVIAGHTSFGDGALWQYGRAAIYSFHMPLYFVLSGYTMKKSENWKTLCKSIGKDVLRLWIPFALTVAVNALIDILFMRTPVKDSMVAVLQSFKNGNVCGLYVGALWFLCALLLAKISYRILLFFTWKVRPFLVAALPIISILLPAEKRYPYFLEGVFVCLLFIEVGYLYKQYAEKKDSHIWTVLFAAVGWGIMTIVFKVQLDLNSHIYNYLSILNAVVGSYLFIKLGKLLEKTAVVKPLSFLGRSSLLFLCIHGIEYQFDFFSEKFIPWMQEGWMQYGMRIVADVCVVIVLALLFQKIKRRS